MPRLNIEDEWFEDPRRDKLIEKIGPLVADGLAVKMWKLAQTYFRVGKLTPTELFEAVPYAKEWEEVGLADRQIDGVYIKGQKDRFAWLLSRSEAGKKGGPAAAKVREKTKKAAQRTATSNDVKTQLPTSSSSASSSASVSSSDSASASTKGAPPALPAEVSPVSQFIVTYVRAFQKRYGATARPALGGKVQGQIRRFLDETSLVRACLLIETFCSMNDPWFLTKAHDFGTFVENLSKVGLALDTGKTTTRTEIKHAEKREHAKGQLERIARGEL